MASQIVHYHDVAWRQGGHEALLDIIGEALAADGSIKDARGIDPVVAKGREEGQRAHLPERSTATSFCPRGAQPRIGLMLVFAQISSMNTSRQGSSRP